MAELKKCPFCGGEAYSYKSKGLLGEMFWGIECKSNECIIHTMIAEYPTEKMAIEAWNNRASEADIRNKAIDDFFDELQKYEKDDWLKLKMLSIYHIAEQLKER